jgi:hypothetical protein
MEARRENRSLEWENDDLRAELHRLKSAGDALANAVAGRDLADPGTWREQLNSALANWEAARKPNPSRR